MTYRQPRRCTAINLLDSKAVAARERLFGEVYDHDIADLERPAASLNYRWCIEGPWKLLVPYPTSDAERTVELFNLADDPNEERNLAAEKPGLVASLSRHLDNDWKPEVASTTSGK